MTFAYTSNSRRLTGASEAGGSILNLAIKADGSVLERLMVKSAVVELSRNTLVRGCPKSHMAHPGRRGLSPRKWLLAKFRGLGRWEDAGGWVAPS